MDATAPLPGIPDQQPAWDKATKLARNCELDGLARRLEDLAAQARGGNPQAG